MKKVLMVATVVKLHIMVFHIPILEWFKKNGYEVHVAARNDYENKEECNIPFCDKFFDLPFERSPLKTNNLLATKELRGLMDSYDYDIIHCHTPVGGAIARIAAHKSSSKNTKVIYTAHGFHFFKGAPIVNWLIYYPIERWLARYTDVLITINKEDYMRVKQNFKAKKIECIPGIGIDTKKITQTTINRPEKREVLGIPDDGFILLSVGELNKNKNHEIVIKAIGKLANPRIHYIICGQGMLDSHLKALAKEKGIEKQIHLLGFREDIPEICKASDIFVFPSFREGLSVALMEAMAVGMPVICSDIRGNVDLIKCSKGGYLCKNNIDEYVNAINTLLEDEKMRDNMGCYNKERAKQYDVKVIKKQIKRIYQEVLNE